MNEFLRNLRNQQKEKSSSSRRVQSEKSSYPHPDRRSGYDRRSQSALRSGFGNDNLTKKVTELIPDLRILMEAVIETNDRIAESIERFVAMEERRNIIFESIGRSLEAVASRGLSVSEDYYQKPEFKKTKKIPREEKNKIMDMIFSMRENGSTYEQIAEYLEAERIPTFSNKGHWHAQTIHRLYQQKKRDLNS